MNILNTIYYKNNVLSGYQRNVKYKATKVASPSITLYEATRGYTQCFLYRGQGETQQEFDWRFLVTNHFRRKSQFRIQNLYKHLR